MSNISIRTASVEKSNLGLIQNEISVVQSIIIINDSSGDLYDLTINIISDPVEALSGSVPIPLIREGELYLLETPKVYLSLDFFRKCRGINGSLKVQLLKDQEVLAEEHLSMEYTSGDSWLKKKDWQDKLLDLTFRNRLLNIRTTLSTVRIECSNPGQVEDILADNSSFELLPNPEIVEYEEEKKISGIIDAQKILDGFSQKKLFTNLIESRFQSVLKKLFRNIRNVQEETGANTLYLSLGILEWYEPKQKDKIRHSPLILVPVELKKIFDGTRYSISMRDDETVFNYTLLQKLSRDYNLKFPCLDPLPKDESGVDVNLIFSIIREVIKGQNGWKVQEDVWLSEFSFQKYLMWKELAEQFPRMLKNPIVNKVTGDRREEIYSSLICEDQVENHLPLDNLFCPLLADSSQLAAILSATEGKSFVLQGPPGTGKSQTITNMIAHCIAHNKRVLFVSEKKVALEVVYKRLKAVGLGPYCLELHSKKTEKKAVVKSVYEALEARSIHSGNEWEQVARKLDNIRGGLNNYFRELHDISTGGISAYKAFAMCNRNSSIHRLVFDKDLVFSRNLQEVSDIIGKIEAWQTTSGLLTDLEYQSWKYCGLTSWSSGIENELSKIINSIIENKKNIIPLLRSKSNPLPFSLNWTETQWNIYSDIINFCLCNLGLNSNFLKSVSWSKYKRDLNDCLERLNDFENKKKQLGRICDPELLKENLNYLQQLNDTARNGFIIKKLTSSIKLKKILKKYSRVNKRYNEIITLACEIKERQGKNCTDLVYWGKWSNIDFNIDKFNILKDQIGAADLFLKQVSILFGEGISEIDKAKSAFISFFDNIEMILSDDSIIRENLNAIFCILRNQKKNNTELHEKFCFKDSIIKLENSEYEQGICGIKTSMIKFRDVCVANSIRLKISGSGFENLFLALDNGKIKSEDLVETFEFNFYTFWLLKKMDTSQMLKKLSGEQLNIIDNEYKRTFDEYHAKVNKALVSRVTKGKPHPKSFILSSSPLGTIIKENKKSRKHLPIRKYLSITKPVIKKLKPCFLMSPMSVSQYLDVESNFDVVIFDEASQIQPWDAIGSMARGKNVIVVGDSKQLPPTSFFNVNGEDNDDEKIDCESVLELFAKLYPEMLLKWHYRSRSESLISFSNSNIYNNRLHTFPSAKTNDQAVSLEVVEGENAYYDRGASKTNKQEAMAIVAELMIRLNDKSQTDSIGIVAFSNTQASLIEDYIDEEIVRNPDLAEFFNPDNEEYIFVKNLENVQGDERDVIFFSIGYGKDKKGVLHRNFGPLNNRGGERRLNVAITRAREEVKIYSNFKSAELDAGSSKFRGLSMLKDYLTFAEYGYKANNTENINIHDNTRKTLFEDELASSLRDSGWGVHTKIGVGGYKVDLGIINPDNPDRFLAGIECDNTRYHSAKSARDRDILRKSVMEGLGWNIIRIWSTDWWYDREMVLKQIEEKLSEYQNQKGRIDDIIDTDEIPGDEGEIYEEALSNPVFDSSIINISPQGDFFRSEVLIKNQIDDIVNILGPIPKNMCFRIVRNCWSFLRSTVRVNSILEECSSHIIKTDSEYGEFFWKSEDHIREIDALRLPKYNSKRHPRDIAPQELAAGIFPILELNKEVEAIELYRLVSRQLGFSAVSKEIASALRESINYLVEENLLAIHGDKIILCY